jgi:signal transduction histidine kinase
MTEPAALGMPRSLKLRLVAAAAWWAMPVLVLSGALLHWAFLAHLERQLDAALVAFQRELLAAVEIGADGTLTLRYQPADPRFARPLSGWYWQIAQDGAIVAQSPSAGPLGPGALPLLSSASGIVEIPGPAARELRILSNRVTLPGAVSPITILVAAPCDEIERDLNQFTIHILATFIVLGIAFLVAVYLQVGFGLRPLAEMRRQIAAIRSGHAGRLSGTFPEEIAPMAEEVNALIDHNRDLLQRARNEAGNLAHALKNPLSVISHEIAQLPEAQRRLLGQQVEMVTGRVERILKRIRAVGPTGPGQTPAPLRPTCDDLVFSLRVIYRARNLALSTDVPADLAFAGDADDLAEMIGNLADNACKWAKAKVTISASRSGDRLRIVVEDDGPGIARAAREAALARGRRLDESMPGSGIGLDIVREIAALYRGNLLLDTGGQGGLRAELDLPAA